MLATHPLTMPSKLTARLGSFSSTASLRSARTSCPTCWATSAYLETTFAAWEKRSRACQKVLRMASERSVSACRKARQAISREPAMETCSFNSSLKQKIVSCSVVHPLASPIWSDGTCARCCLLDEQESAPFLCSCDSEAATSPLTSETSLVLECCVTMVAGATLAGCPLETSVTSGLLSAGADDNAGAGTDVAPSASHGCLRQASKLNRLVGFTRSNPRTMSLACSETLCHAAVPML
mmetsp:Transcript_53855/g.172663  ORF Transcript_53855/g.172663 Transcript_53855/m.172663 type:complete len:238 (+) Transcript_53855:1483-2196(+)